MTSLESVFICVNPCQKLAGLLLAVVDDAGDFAAEVLAGDDHVDEAVLEHELGGLEAVGQLDLDGLGDGAGPGEADLGARLAPKTSVGHTIRFATMTCGWRN
jgi:hypothetical protein